jgi:mannose-6-phosphate isomerase-like protein (cupin superfamily)
MITKVNLQDKLSLINSHWDPKIVGELNEQLVKLVKFQGEFVWHSHENEDELFFVVRGSFDMLLRDGVVTVSEGEFVIVPRGVEHCPKAEKEVHVMLFEPTSTLNTGDATDERAVHSPERI